MWILCVEQSEDQSVLIYLLLPPSVIGSQEEKDAKKAKALELSLQYSFVTPLTSMVVTKPETEDSTDSPLIADKLTEGEREVFIFH